jgi:hypothetical protein
MIEALPPTLEAKIRKFGRIDLIVGIPSCNNVDTIEYVILRVAEGLSKFFSDRKSLILISDGGSTDGTREIASSLKLHAGIKKIVALYKGISGKGSAVRLILEAAKILNANGVALVDSDLRSIVPEWIELLLKPLEGRADLVTPLYKRYKYDGTITNQIVFPFTRAIYGMRVRQPIGGEFGISRVLVEHLLSSPLWANPYTPRFGIDVFITHTAIAFKLPVVEALLGAKVHSVKDPTEHLAPMFRQVVGSMFDAMALYEHAWRDVKGSRSIPLVKSEFEIETPESFTVDIQAPVRTFKQGFVEHRSLFESNLPSDLYNSLLAESKRSNMKLYIPMDVWAKTAYTFAAAFKKERQQDKRDLLLDALRFCWNGRLGTFFQETLDMTSEQAEKKVLQEARIFEKLKPYLLSIY